MSRSRLAGYFSIQHLSLFVAVQPMVSIKITSLDKVEHAADAVVVNVNVREEVATHKLYKLQVWSSIYY